VAADAIAPRRPYANSFGGGGATPVHLLCPDNAPVITGVHAWAEGETTIIINTVHVFCGAAQPNQPVSEYPSAVFDGPLIWQLDPNWKPRPQVCPAGLVPVGITGRSGIWLNAFGLICGRLPTEAMKPAKPVIALGRVSPQSPPGPARHICEAARDARARNSPAAPNLEAQCRAAPPPAAPPAPPAPAAITAMDLQSVMARGLVLSNNDPLAAELRRRLAETGGRRGFDAGMGAWAGNTEPGPGKLRYRDVLPVIEQGGFDLAATYSFARNRHELLSNVGYAIARANRDVARARMAEDDVFYWLGFDIATGIFGDPAAGARGNTATGPGSLGIRNELNPAAQRGFNASTQFHLTRRVN
jgi:hypothetical protein